MLSNVRALKLLTIEQIEKDLAGNMALTVADQSSVPIGELEARLHKAVGQWGDGLGISAGLKCKLVCTIVPPNCTLACDIEISL